MIVLRRLLRQLDYLENKKKVVIAAMLGGGIALMGSLAGALFYGQVVVLKEASQQKTTAYEATEKAMQKLQGELAQLDPQSIEKRVAEAESQLAALRSKVAQKQEKSGPQVIRNGLENILGELRDIRVVNLSGINSASGDALVQKYLGDEKLNREELFGVELALQGGFAETVELLKRIESIPGRLLWDSLNYQVGEYPNASVQLRFFMILPVSEELDRRSSG